MVCTLRTDPDRATHYSPGMPTLQASAALNLDALLADSEAGARKSCDQLAKHGPSRDRRKVARRAISCVTGGGR